MKMSKIHILTIVALAVLMGACASTGRGPSSEYEKVLPETHTGDERVRGDI